MRRNLTLEIAPHKKSLRNSIEHQLIKNQEHGIVSAGVCDPTRPAGKMTTSRRRAVSCPRGRSVGEGAAGRWVSLLCLLMCVATGKVLASQGGSTKGRAASAAGGSGGRISGNKREPTSGGGTTFSEFVKGSMTVDETIDSEEQDIREDQRRGRWTFAHDHDPVVSAIKSMKDLFPNVRFAMDPTTSLKLRKRIYPLKTVLTLGADYDTQIGVWQFRSTWEDSIIGGRISIAGREVSLSKSWLLKVMDQEDVATRLKFRAAINTRDWTATAKFGFRTERISPVNIQDGFQLARKFPLDGNSGHAKLEVVTKLALPEPELRFSTNGDRSKGVVAGMGDVDIGIQEFNLLLEY